MTTKDSSIDEAPATLTLQRLLTVIQAVQEVVDTEDQSEGRLDRLERLVARGLACLDHVDPDLVTGAELDALYSSGQASITLLSAAQAAFDEDLEFDLSSLPQSSDAIASVIRNWAFVDTQPSVIGLEEAMRTTVTQIERDANEARQRLTESMEAAGASLGKLENKIEEAALTANTQIEKLTAVVTAQGLTATSQTQELDAAIAEHTQTFKQGEEQRKLAFSEDRKALASDAESTIEQLDEHLKQAEDLVGVISKTAMASGYQQHADAEATSANKWRLCAFWLGVTSAVVVLGMTTAGAIFEPSARVLIAGAVASASFAGLATYCAKQSTHHRHNGERSRSLELSLKAIGPYLAQLPEEKRNDILVKFADTYFLPVEPNHNSTDDVIAPAQVTAALSAVQGSKAPAA